MLVVAFTATASAANQPTCVRVLMPKTTDDLRAPANFVWEAQSQVKVLYSTERQTLRSRICTKSKKNYGFDFKREKHCQFPSARA